MKLIEIARILRSKNAGPLFVTFDLMFGCREDMEMVLAGLKTEDVAAAYGIDPGQISVIPYEIVNSIKITFPRKHISGCVSDDDVYGCQQHMPLANLEIWPKEKR